jgi:hypothetical protein
VSRATRGPARQQRSRRRQEQRKLSRSQEAAGIRKASHTTRPNRTSPYESVEQEEQARTEAVIEHARLIREKLPTLLKELSRIPDPRKPLLVRHKLSTLMVYGILMFVLQTGSRRKSNEKLSAPAMKNALMELFPELESIPHHDTLYRLLAGIDPQRIEEAQVALVRSLIRDKKLSRHLVQGCYLIAIDGTHKMTRGLLPDDAWLQRQVGAEGNKRTQYYVYVLEANLVLSNGVSIPLMSEFLDYGKGDSEGEKQDCEQRAFFRLADRLKKAFPHLRIMVLLDGLSASGPVMSRCRDYGWQFMIVLQGGSLPQVWQEYHGLRRLLTKEERLSQRWGDREQSFELVNDIQYCYGDNQRKRLTIHLVVCQESWEEVDAEGTLVQRSSRWAWISDLPFSRETVHVRCNLAGRHRWGIEEGFLVEKRQGYDYEHCYAENWNAMRGYHYLMRIGHLLNLLASFAGTLIEAFKERGAQGFIAWLSSTLSGRWLTVSRLQASLTAPFQLRLLFPLPDLPVPTG